MLTGLKTKKKLASKPASAGYEVKKR